MLGYLLCVVCLCVSHLAKLWRKSWTAFFPFVLRVRTPQFGRNGFSLTCATICMKNIHTAHESYVRMYVLYRVKQHPSVGIHRSRKNRSMAFTRTQSSTATLQTVLLIEQGLTSAPTQYRLYGRRFLQVWWPNQQCQSTEGGWLVIQTGLSLTRLISP